jgi:hypothetical protein
MESKNDMTNYLGLSGLIFACPFGETTNCCPFASLHKMQIDDRIDYIESLPNYQIMSLLNKHKDCLNKRELKAYRYRIDFNNYKSFPVSVY